jgi:hypothetical protein
VFLGGLEKGEVKYQFTPLYGYHLPLVSAIRKSLQNMEILGGMYNFLVGPAPEKELWNQVAVYIHPILASWVHILIFSLYL